MPETAAKRSDTPTVRFTYEDYCLAPDDGKRREIIDGVEYILSGGSMAPAPRPIHQRIAGRIFGEIYQHLKHMPVGEVFDAPLDVILSETDVVQPDVLFVSDERAGIIEEHGLTGPPDLVVEVLSESNRRRDEVRKRKLYEQYGVTEYWIVDPELELVKVYRQSESGAGFGEKTEHSREKDATLQTALLSDFEISLDALFA